MSTETAQSELVTASTVAIDDPGELLELLPTPQRTLSWCRDGDGLVGWGEAASYTPNGADRFSAARNWWADFTAGLAVRDEVGLPGTGPVAFASMAFSAEPGDSALIVPRVLVGRRNGVSWLTTIGAGESAEHQPVTAPGALSYSDGELGVDGYRNAVSLAVQRIRAGELDKVVLAYDLLATAGAPIDERYLLRELAANYPTCWTYAVDGLIGATPEMLLRRDGDEVSALLLAGTAWPRQGVTEEQLARELLDSAKNREEHEYGVQSLVDTLSPFCSGLDVPAEPSILQLPNVVHLATEVRGRLRADASLLELTEQVHPTAAVGGTPTAQAVRAIRELEGRDRRRYAGPIGWLDARGNGEFGIALRCAEISGNTARLFAGGGIVADSDPDNEAAEAGAKFRAIRSALDH